ncbi:MAG: protein O-mannosyl-transferase family, partial [Anaerolineae bacterium]
MFAQRWKVDGLVAGGFFLASLALYLKTLGPSVLEGDSALFQYAPYTLAVTYPTGYPIYLLLGKLWVTLVPLGSIAYRMNLLSAF